MEERRRPGSDRRAISLLVKLAHRGLDEFAEQYATNLSPGGMFIRARDPKPIGTSVLFRVEIAGGQRVLQGEAMVKWVRPPNDPAGPPGMGLEFTNLDPASQALIDKMLSSRVSALPDAEVVEESPVPPPPLGTVDVDLDALLSSTPGSTAPPLLADDFAPPPSFELDVDFDFDDPLPLPPLPSAAPLPLPPLPSAAPHHAPPPPAVTPARAPPAPLAPPRVAPAQRPVTATHAAVPPRATPSHGTAPIPHPTVTPSRPPPPPPRASPPPPIAPAAPQAAPDFDKLPPVRRVKSAPATIIPPAPPPIDFDQLPPLKRVAQPPPAPAMPAPILTPVPGSPTVIVEDQRPLAPPPLVPVLVEATLAPPRRRGTASAPIFLKPPATIAATGPVVGIDLGTTNSAVAVLNRTKPAILSSKDGYNTIPSVVSLAKNGTLVVGHRAKSQLLLNPAQSIVGAKRLVGRDFDSATVQQVRERFHYEIVEGSDGKAAVVLGANVLSLEEVQGIVLKECKAIAEERLGQPVSRAVITCPANYNEAQREALRRAGGLAGLKVERILNEPTAAALAYGLNRELSKQVLVYDLGGGTFDATVLRIDKNVFEVLATGGDIFLGGMDFDNQVVDVLLAKFELQHGSAFGGDPMALARIVDQAERSKIALSEKNTDDVLLPMLEMTADGKPLELRCTVSRDELNQCCATLVDRTLDVCRDVLLDAKLKVNEVEDVIVVGGMSRMPLVREKLKQMFGHPPQASVNADEAVALGAALFSGTVDKVSSVVLIDVVPMTIGLALPGGSFKRVIERNTPLPATKSFGLSTSRDNEEVLEFNVFQGEDNNISSNEYLGTVRIEGLPKGPKGSVKVSVSLKLDPECVLHVEAREHHTHRTYTATFATRYTAEEIKARLHIASGAPSEADTRRAKELEGRAGRFWGFIKRVIKRSDA